MFQSLPKSWGEEIRGDAADRDGRSSVGEQFENL